MRRRSGAVWVIVASGVCAGLLWASQGLAELVRQSSLSRVGVPALTEPDARPEAGAMSGANTWAGATSRARPRNRVGIAAPTLLPASLQQQPYSMAAPEFLSDPAAAAARSIAVGDISGDGRDDLVFLSLRYAPQPGDVRMEIYAAYQRGDGRLDPAVKIAESDNSFAYQLLVADLDRDGVGDIITTVTNGVLVLRSNADGTFASSTAAVVDPFDIVVTDVDRDDHLDILVDSSNTLATVLYGDGRGGIDTTSTLPLPSSAVRTTGDVTGDGLDDLILATIFDSPLQEFRVYPALVSGGYAAPVILSRPIDANQTASLAVGDFNADGRGDLVMDEAKDDAGLHLYFQDAHGNLASSLDIARNRGSGVLLAADLNRDGKTDIAMAHSGWNYIGYYLQTSAGFTPENVINANQNFGRANYFAAGDLNHDGCGDLVVSRWSQSPVLLYGQGCSSPRIADCRLPPRRVEGSGVAAAGLASPLMGEHNGNGGANAGEGVTRGAGTHGRNGYGVRGMLPLMHRKESR